MPFSPPVTKWHWSSRNPTGRPVAQASPVKRRAEELAIPVAQPRSLKAPGFDALVSAAAADAIVVVAYGRILPGRILETAPRGAINVHFSLLPELRGAAPVQWALARGYEDTGVTTFRLDEGLDTGDVLLQEPVVIAPGEHAPALLARLAETGARLLVATLDGLAAGSVPPRPQDGARATQAPILTRDDGRWQPTWTARTLEGRVRGFDPWPGVWARRGGPRLRIVEARALIGASSDAEPGTMLGLAGDAMRLSCADGSVAEISRVQTEGRRAVSAREAASGRQLAPGDRLGPIEPAA
jgi:methionyl-tRNA formyltransferase